MLSGCAAGDITVPDADIPVDGLSGDDVGVGAPGTLIDSEQLAEVDPALVARGATVHRIRYLSAMVASDPPGDLAATGGTGTGGTGTGGTGTGGTGTGGAGTDGVGVEVTGVVVVPAGPAPAEGRPIVAVGHGTTGLADECAPSLYPNLLGAIAPVTAALDMGAVVVATDYRGLGTDADHPYLDARASARDLIDSVRAAHHLVPDTSTRWAGLGVSQGGQAVWAAAELAGDLAPDLEFVGGAALSPVADLSGWVDPAGQLQLTGPQRSLYPLVVTGAAVSDAAIAPIDYLPDIPADVLTSLTGCAGALSEDKFAAFAELDATDLQPRTPELAAQLRQWLEAGALPLQPAGGPMLVVVAGRDTLITPESTTAAVRRACELGAPVDLLVRPDDQHADGAAIADAVSWLTPVLRGEAPGAVGDGCALPA